MQLRILVLKPSSLHGSPCLKFLHICPATAADSFLLRSELPFSKPWAYAYTTLQLFIRKLTALSETVSQVTKKYTNDSLIRPRLVAELPRVLLGIRTAPNEDLNCSSSELVYGTPLSVPGNFWPSTAATSSSPESEFLPWL